MFLARPHLDFASLCDLFDKKLFFFFGTIDQIILSVKISLTHVIGLMGLAFTIQMPDKQK